MALEHAERPVHGVQFHPESILSQHGETMVRNFLDLATAWNAGGRNGGTRGGQARPRCALTKTSRHPR